MEQPKILYFDIETSLELAGVWHPGKQYVSAEQILKEWKLLTISWMWDSDKGKPKALKMDMSKHDINAYDDDADKEMLIEFMKVYSKADLTVAHNGRRFDIAKMRARLVKFELPDISPVMFDDSYGFTKNIAFTSHKLDHLGKFLGVGRKTHVGLDCWINIMKGDKKALNKMAEYNKQDVILLRDVYRKLRRYGKSKLNMSAFVGRNTCSYCRGPTVMRKDGFKYTNAGKFQVYECGTCMKKVQDGVNLIKGSKLLLR